jgi:hypothetical protein
MITTGLAAEAAAGEPITDANTLPALAIWKIGEGENFS